MGSIPPIPDLWINEVLPENVTINQDEEVFALGAQSMKNAFDALVKVGFTEEQAMLIVANQGTGVKTS